MKNMKTINTLKISLLSIIIFLVSSTNAQQKLTIDDAISIALKTNFDILVAKNDATIAKVNNTAGNAGMLPTLELTGSAVVGQSNTHQKLADGTENNYSSLSTTSLSAGTQLSWTLFDGGKMFVTKNKLNEIQALGEMQFKDKVMQTLYSVTSAYYDVVRQKQQLNSINEALKYSRERVSIAQAGFKAGSLIKSELLMAKIDLNVAMENEINQQYVIQTVRNNLNVNLAQNNNSVYEITDSIVLNYSPDKLSLLQKLNSSNTNILAFQKQIEIAQLSLKENRSLYLPQLDFKAGYYLSQSANSQGSIRNNTTIGPQVGGTLIVPIYSAGENKRKVSTAKIMVQNAQYDLRNVKLQVNTEFENAFTEFENQQQLLKIERENNSLAKENIQICLERLRLGQSTSLEVRLAQQDYVQSSTRLINFQYNLKIAETKLKQLVSTL